MDGHSDRENKENHRSPGAAAGATAAAGGMSGAGDPGADPCRVPVSEFNYTVDEFFQTSDRIASLCGVSPAERHADPTEVQRFSSMITFLREWRYFKYESKIVNFANETVSPQASKPTINGVHLPQFSSASVPKSGDLSGQSGNLNCKDFVLHAGGSVWALDWCPSAHERSNSSVKCEFLAVAAHPPGSSYQRLGLPLTGRGIIQIWCVLNVTEGGSSTPEIGVTSFEPRPRGRPKKKEKSSSLRPIGRPKKYPVDSSDEGIQPSIEQPRGRERKHPSDSSDGSISHSLKRPRGRPRKFSGPDLAGESSACKRPRGRPRKLTGLAGESSGCMSMIPCSSGSNRVADLSTEKQSDPPKRCRGRPRKNLGVPKALDSQNGVADTFVPAFPNGVAEDAPVLAGMHRLHGNDGENFMLDAKADDVLSRRAVDIVIKRTPPRPRRVKPGKKSVETECSDALYGDQAASTQSYPVITLGFGGEISTKSPVVRKIDEGPGLRFERDGRASSACIGEDSYIDIMRDNYAIKSSSSRCIPKIRMKEKARAIGSVDVHSPSLPTINEENELFDCDNQGHDSVLSQELKDEVPLKIETTDSNFQKEIVFPRVVMCLAHMGKVAWDAKWRPFDSNGVECRSRLGYLAVLLGNGSLEVWEVPHPDMVKTLFISSNNEGMDPRFLRLKPVFRCSKLQCGGTQSIPLIMEWSPSSPYDLILAGCHDGSVALWKFSAVYSSPDTKPLLCFSADTVPIRGIAWAPDESDAESANLIMTAGHEGLKIWDIRDPYHPLWVFTPAQKHIMGVDWLRDPRWIILSHEDGYLRILNLWKATSTFPDIGTSPAPRVHSSACSSFAIWSVHVSRATGLVAYCGADGCTNCFKLKVSQNRMQHFRCGSLVEDDHNNLVINSPMFNSPLKHIPLSRPVRGNQANSNRSHQDAVDEGYAIVPYDGNTETSMKNLASSKSKSSQKGDCPKQGDSLGEEQENLQSGANMQPVKAREFFPSKNVSMHKVRWNMNRESERWLCYGGASGIIRCQEIPWASTMN